MVRLESEPNLTVHRLSGSQGLLDARHLIQSSQHAAVAAVVCRLRARKQKLRTASAVWLKVTL